jgi:hypothetical protein
LHRPPKEALPLPRDLERSLSSQEPEERLHGSSLRFHVSKLDGQPFTIAFLVFGTSFLEKRLSKNSAQAFSKGLKAKSELFWSSFSEACQQSAPDFNEKLETTL